MKRGNRAALVLVALVLLTACGSRVDSTVTTEEIVVPEMSSEDLLVNSLEYLLQEDEKKEEAAEDAASDDEAAESVSLVLYYSNGACDGLDSQVEEAQELTAEALIAALARHNIVSLDTKVISFREEEEEEGKVLYLNLSAEMNHYLNTMTKEAKNVIIESITSTFLENYHADIIHIQIAGKPLEQSVIADEA